jgi:hypothetical protein
MKKNSIELLGVTTEKDANGFEKEVTTSKKVAVTSEKILSNKLTEYSMLGFVDIKRYKLTYSSFFDKHYVTYFKKNGVKYVVMSIQRDDSNKSIVIEGRRANGAND